MVGPGEEHRPQQRPTFEIDRGVDLRAQDLGNAALLVGVAQSAQVGGTPADRATVADHLQGSPQAGGAHEGGAQDLVAVDRPLQCSANLIALGGIEEIEQALRSRNRLSERAPQPFLLAGEKEPDLLVRGVGLVDVEIGGACSVLGHSVSPRSDPRNSDRQF